MMALHFGDKPATLYAKEDFRVSPRCESPSYKHNHIMINHSFSPKMFRKKFENRFTNENLMSKMFLKRDFA